MASPEALEQKPQNRACIHENELAHWKNGFKQIPLGTD
jgi:hypothetical protein